MHKLLPCSNIDRDNTHHRREHLSTGTAWPLQIALLFSMSSAGGQVIAELPNFRFERALRRPLLHRYIIKAAQAVLEHLKPVEFKLHLQVGKSSRVRSDFVVQGFRSSCRLLGRLLQFLSKESGSSKAGYRVTALSSGTSPYVGHFDSFSPSAFVLSCLRLCCITFIYEALYRDRMVNVPH